MPRPTAAQLVYGSATVVLATLAMLLLSDASTTLAVGVVCCAALVLGVLVAVTAPTPRWARGPVGAGASGAARTGRAPARTSRESRAAAGEERVGGRR